MTSALVAMVTGWSEAASRRCARPELDLDMLIRLRPVLAIFTVVQSAHTLDPSMYSALCSTGRRRATVPPAKAGLGTPLCPLGSPGLPLAQSSYPCIVISWSGVCFSSFSAPCAPQGQGLAVLVSALSPVPSPGPPGMSAVVPFCGKLNLVRSGFYIATAFSILPCSGASRFDSLPIPHRPPDSGQVMKAGEGGGRRKVRQDGLAEGEKASLLPGHGHHGNGSGRSCLLG